MAINPEQIELLTRLISETRDQEVNCEQFLSQLAEGISLDKLPEEFRQHLRVCPECAEEFRMLTEVIEENS